MPTGLLDGSVPPINVLIVEDNPINLRLLEAFMKRLKVRWQTAMNGREAVTKWRGGGFHLVLMDIQMPVMNGLEAAKEIRRLERVNGVGVLAASVSGRSSAAGRGSENGEDEEGGKKNEVEAVDRLMNTALFKSPVIIVALTASSLQSDRHEALAAGCNDFLTKVCPFFLPFPLSLSIRPSSQTTTTYFPISPFPLLLLPPPLTPPLTPAPQLRLARTQSHGMGLHASAHRLRRLAQMERFLAGQARRARFPTCGAPAAEYRFRLHHPQRQQRRFATDEREWAELRSRRGGGGYERG